MMDPILMGKFSEAFELLNKAMDLLIEMAKMIFGEISRDKEE